MPRADTTALPVPIKAAARRPPCAGPLIEAQRETRRGLRGGPEVLETARRAYLGAQWSGEHDRRPEPGLLTRARL